MDANDNVDLFFSDAAAAPLQLPTRRLKSTAHAIVDDLHRFKGSPKWCALDHSSRVSSAVFYLAFLLFAVAVPIATAAAARAPAGAGLEMYRAAQLPESALAAIAFLTLSAFFAAPPATTAAGDSAISSSSTASATTRRRSATPTSASSTAPSSTWPSSSSPAPPWSSPTKSSSSPPSRSACRDLRRLVDDDLCVRGGAGCLGVPHPGVPLRLRPVPGQLRVADIEVGGVSEEIGR